MVIGTKFVGKADEDSWINIVGILRYLSYPQASKSITGHFLWNEKTKRRVEEKWYLTKEEYANGQFQYMKLCVIFDKQTDSYEFFRHLSPIRRWSTICVPV